VNSCEMRRCDRGELLLVTSNGEAPDHAGGAMGLYQVMSVNYNSAPAYRQVHNVSGTEPHYIFKSDKWYAGPELGNINKRALKNSNSSPAPPRSGWQYNAGDGEFVSDPNLSIVTISDTSNRICPVINIRARGAAARKVPDALGRFTITNQFSVGRPVWRNNKGKYLSAHPGSSSWLVRDNVETAAGWIQSGAAPGLCPASARSRYNKRGNQNSWQYYDGGLFGIGSKWRDGDITVTCNRNIVCN